jgi:3-hydroxyacyl-[acyl-carrier-protein] dehydratase
MTRRTLELSVPSAHPAYAGHFPGRPILPGALLLDEALHALAEHEGIPRATCSVKSAKFPSPVRPGEALELRYAATPSGDFRFEVFAGGRAVVTGVVAFPARDARGTAA